MNFKPHEAKTLEDWLEIATMGIAAAGRERIAREIEVHFAEAVETGLANGENEESAAAVALRQLGNARTARRRFRKQHLTKLEEWRVSGLRKWSGGGRTLYSICWALYLTLLFSMRDPKHSQSFFVPIWIAWIVLPFLLFIVTSRAGYELKPLSLLTLLSLQSFQFATLFFWSALGFFKESVPVAGWLSILSLVVITVLSFQTWRKIRTHENPTAEKPEGNTPGAA